MPSRGGSSTTRDRHACEGRDPVGSVRATRTGEAFVARLRRELGAASISAPDFHLPAQASFS
jgi:hypothetical protein